MSVTLVLIALTVATSVAAWQRPSWLDALLYAPDAVERGQWWRLLTHGFVHADGNHLLFNMITFFFFGRSMESVLSPHIGTVGYTGFYLGGIAVAILPSHLRHRAHSGYRSLGASGGVSAVLFAYILLQPWSMLLVFVVPVPAIVFAAAYIGYSVWAERNAGDRINHGAHLAGAAWGVLFMLTLEPRLLGGFVHELMSPLG